MPLITTKLYIPPKRSNLVTRAPLVERLNQALERKLTLISAPPGFGKTTTLSEWIPQSAHCVCWLSLDKDDNDPTRFWTYFIAALQRLNASLGVTALTLLKSSQGIPLESIVTLLVNDMGTFPDPFAFVLDDYHIVETTTIHDSVTFLLDHLPSNVHLIITSRADPPLPLAQFRARGELLELRAADLRFTTDEATELLNQVMNLNLSAQDIAALETRTEGWIAGLQLAALSMREREGRASFITAFTGSHRFILDYLVEQVLQRQSSDLQDFMLGTSTLERMCAGLCEAVTGRRDSQSVLEQMENRNLFLVSLDDERRWYRYHHLFADVLRSRLSADQAGRIPALHQRASEWFERQGLMAEAIDHALLGSDLERSARLIEENGYPIMLRGHVQTVLSWLNSFPGERMGAHPRLCAIYASALMFGNQPEAAEGQVRAAEKSVFAQDSPEESKAVLGLVAVTRANIALRFPGDLAQAVQLARQSLELMPSTERIAVASARVIVAHDFLVSGDVGTAAERLVNDVLAAARSSGSLFALLRSLVLVARLRALQGQLRQAARLYEPVAQLAPGGRLSLIGSPGYFMGQGDLLREWNDLAAAERHLVQGLELFEQNLTMDAETVTWGSIALAQVKRARGDLAVARATLHEFLELASQRGFAVPLTKRGKAALAQIELSSGNIQDALRWQQAAEVSIDDAPAFSREAEHLTLVRVLIATEQAAGALRLLDRLLPAAQARSRMSSVIEMLVLRGLALHSQREDTLALASLEQAMALAQPEGYIRTLIDEGEPMRELLRLAASRGIAGEYVSELLAAFGTTSSKGPAGSGVPTPALVSSTLVEPLSTRELQVLHLIADGASNQEIAEKLVISIATVKRHISNIYGKLEVTSRTQAVAHARELKLL